MRPARSSVSQPETSRGSSRNWPVWLLAVCVTFGLPSIFSSGTCHWHVGGCDDDDFDDDHCDDDDNADSTAQKQLKQDPRDPYRLVEYERVASHVPGSHPVSWLRHIRGINLFHAEGPASYQQADFEMFTGLLIQTNKDLLGLPRSAGLLTFDGAEFEEETSPDGLSAQAGLRVRWRQEAQQPDGTWKLVPGSEVVFYFDAVGNLVTVRNHTWVELPQR